MMTIRQHRRVNRRRRVLGAVGSVLVLAGCVGTPTPSERAARQDLRFVASVYRPANQRPTLPALTPEARLEDFLTFAMLNQPRVEAAYYAWMAAVERITTARSLPDPQLTFQTDIQNVVQSLMPGLMVNLPGPGKLKAGAAVASQESAVRYSVFEASALQAAFDMKKAYYQLYFLAEKIRVNQRTLGLLGDLEKLARAQNAVGKVTLQDVLRAQIERDRLTTDIANLQDSRAPLVAAFGAALGLNPDHPEPPLPRQFESTPLDAGSDRLLAAALAGNPRLRGMEAEVRQAEAAIALARKARVPDFTVGVQTDVKASPAIWTPQLGMTLPIWRDKIAAQIAEAQALKHAAAARLSAEQIALAVDFADKMFSYREATRNLELLRDQLLPKARQSLAVARSGYLAGQIDFFNLIDAERTLLAFELANVEARTSRELVLAELSLIIVGQPPAGAPTLSSASYPNPKTTTVNRKPPL
jgi:outer membrane protein TolC